MSELTDRVVATLTRYLATPAVVGAERPFLAVLAAECTDLGLDVTAGDHVVEVRGDRPGGVVSVHIDRHGLVSTGDGTLRYAAHQRRLDVGETPLPSGRTSTLVCSRVADEEVVAYDPDSGAEIQRLMLAHNCAVEDGVVVGAPGLDVAAGTPVGYAEGCAREGDFVRGQLDNTLSAALVRELFERGFGGTAYFTAEEEIGNSWSHLLTHAVAREPVSSLLVLDTSPFDDDAAARSGAVVLRTRDANGVFSADVVASARAAAEAVGAPVIVKDEVIAADNRGRERQGLAPRSLGSTELGRIVAATGGAWNGATIQTPTFGYHTNHEATTTAAITTAVAVLGRLLID